MLGVQDLLQKHTILESELTSVVDKSKGLNAQVCTCTCIHTKLNTHINCYDVCVHVLVDGEVYSRQAPREQRH